MVCRRYCCIISLAEEDTVSVLSLLLSDTRKHDDDERLADLLDKLTASLQAHNLDFGLC